MNGSDRQLNHDDSVAAIDHAEALLVQLNEGSMRI